MGDPEGLLFPLLCLYMYGNYRMPPLVQTHPPSLSDQCDLTKPTALLLPTMIKLAAHLCPAEQLRLYPWAPARGNLLSSWRGMPSGTTLLIYVHPMSVKSERGSNSSIPGRRTESSWSGRNSRQSTSCHRSSE